MTKDDIERPIPQKLLPLFLFHMAAHDFDGMPDGAWFYTLETAAKKFMREHRIKGCENSATFQYLDLKEND